MLADECEVSLEGAERASGRGATLERGGSVTSLLTSASSPPSVDGIATAAAQAAKRRRRGRGGSGSGDEDTDGGSSRTVAVGFFLMGMLNNSVFVIMNAGAKSILAGGVGLIFLFNTFPSLVVKLSWPLWSHRVSYEARVLLVGALMAVSMSTVAYFENTGAQLLGVAVGSFAGAVGEASFLAFTSFYDGPLAITAWSSGTGAAGVFGVLWVISFTQGLGWSFPQCLWLANVLAVAYVAVFFAHFRLLSPRAVLVQYESVRAADAGGIDADVDVEVDGGGGGGGGGGGHGENRASSGILRLAAESDSDAELEEENASLGLGVAQNPTAWQRLRFVLTLRDYMVPLFVVYFAEYSMQSGSWAVIGFPVDSKPSRDRFFLNASWCYQAGVLISRSSGRLLRISKRQLWAMPCLQSALLVFFVGNGVQHWWWNQGLLLLCFVAGLLGGLVYVHAYILISRNTRPSMRELALGSASVADTFGILCANVAGLVIQGCLYGVNGVSDMGKPPVFTCGYTFD